MDPGIARTKPDLQMADVQISTTENPIFSVQVLDRTMYKIQKQSSNLTKQDHR